MLPKNETEGFQTNRWKIKCNHLAPDRCAEYLSKANRNGTPHRSSKGGGPYEKVLKTNSTG